MYATRLGKLDHPIAIPIVVPKRIEKGAGEERMARTLDLISVLAGATLSSIKSFLPTGSQCSLTLWLCKHTQTSSNLSFDQLRTSKLCFAFSPEQMFATSNSHPRFTRSRNISNMVKRKKKLTPVQKAAKEERRKKFMFLFIDGKQVRVRRPETIDGIDIDEFIRRNADPIWLHQNGMHELIDDDAF